jgi:predicted MPP superfamily phosphohydrolase
MSIFIGTFLSVYLLLNLYVIRRVYSLFKVKPGVWFYVLLLAGTVSYVGARLLEIRFDNVFVRGFDFAATLWMGVGLLLFSCLIVHDVINVFYKTPRPKAGFIVTGITAVLSIYALVNGQFISVVEVNIPASVDMRVVHLSDIHLGSVSEGFLKRVIAKTNSLRPDVVLITGDLVDSRNKLRDDSLGLLSNIEAPVFVSTGNHERYVGIYDMEQFLKRRSGIKVLRNKVIDFQGIQIVGIDDGRGKDQVAKQLAELKLDGDKYTVLMYHRPEGVADAEGAGVDLMLSGHTHNGQIFPFNFFVRMTHEYVKGLYEQGSCYLYVSTGTGTWGPSMRLGSKNQITLLRLKKI